MTATTEVQCALLHRCGIKRIRRRLLRAVFRAVVEKTALPLEYAHAEGRHGLFAHVVDVFPALGGEQRRIESWVSDVGAGVCGIVGRCDERRCGGEHSEHGFCDEIHFVFLLVS